MHDIELHLIKWYFESFLQNRIQVNATGSQEHVSNDMRLPWPVPWVTKHWLDKQHTGQQNYSVRMFMGYILCWGPELHLHPYMLIQHANKIFGTFPSLHMVPMLQCCRRIHLERAYFWRDSICPYVMIFIPSRDIEAHAILIKLFPWKCELNVWFWNTSY